MRISDTNSSSKVSSAKKKRGASASSSEGLFSLSSTSDSSATQAPAEAQKTVNIQSVLSLDSLGILSRAGDEEFIKKQNVEWGRDILGNLESIKYQILNGKISYSSLLSLTERLNNIPIRSDDQKLKDIINEIEIRAAVEIEKLKRFTNLT